MSLSADDLVADPNPLARHYRRFRVAERTLLTGHSHQAWPDVAREAQLAAWDDAARLVDGKWDRAFERANRVRRGFADLLGDEDGEIALGVNTHELVVRFLSALPLGDRPRIVTTDGEFHSARRQLDRLAEEGLEVVRVPADPAADVGERISRVVDDRTAAVLVSTVFFETAKIAGGLQETARAARRFGARLLLDAYHHLGVVPFSIEGVEDAWIVGGGYKYCQLGEGNCFLRFPAGTDLRPVITGWFAEFETLDAGDRAGVPYGLGPWRFAGSTYDPTSHYRGAAVFDFFRERGLVPDLLRDVSQHQLSLLIRGFDELDLPEDSISRDRDVPLEELGGFLCFRSPKAGEIRDGLAAVGISTDVRGKVLRLGPAPYLARRQLLDAIAALDEVVRRLD